MKVTIIGKDGVCSKCEMALGLSKARKVDFDYIKVPSDISLEDAFELVGKNFSSFPQIIIHSDNNKIINEPNEYRNYLTENA